MSLKSWGPRVGCAAIIASGKDAGSVCGQLPEHTNHAVWHHYQMPARSAEPPESREEAAR